MIKLFSKSKGVDAPLFEGTNEDFHKYFSGFCRNLVQKITRSHKLEIGCCENCGEASKQLDAAHIHGFERKEIINKILVDFEEDRLIKINLNVFEELFTEAHKPVESVIKILCKNCHNKYDNEMVITRDSYPTKNQESKKTKSHYECARLTFKRNIIEKVLPEETFSIYVRSTNETFRMTRREFNTTFENVALSSTYNRTGIYSYTHIPQKTYSFLVRNINNERPSNYKKQEPLIKSSTKQSSNSLSESNPKKKLLRDKLLKTIFKETGESVDRENFNYSTIIKNGIFWVEPNKSSSKSDWYLCLIHTVDMYVHVFKIPSNSEIYNKLYLRVKENRYRLTFNINDSTFTESYSQERFVHYLISSFPFENKQIFSRDIIL